MRRRIWSGGPEGAGESLRAALLSPQALGAVVALAAALGLAQKRRAAGVAAACGKCGEPFCAECKPGKERQDYCLQCVHLFIRKDGVSPQLRSDKIGEIGRNQTRRRLTSMLLSLLAPGAGHLYRQRPLAGFAALLLWGLGLAVFALGWFAFQQPGFVARAAQVAPLWVGLALAAAVWVAMNAANATLKD